MAEQLPDGFEKRDTLWTPEGRKVHHVDKISKSAREEFAQTGVDFSGSSRQDALAAELAIETAAEEAAKKMSPEFRKLLKQMGAIGDSEFDE
jgi:hypothetical protein